MTEMIQNAKMQWLAEARKIQEDAILYFIGLFWRGLFFICIEFLNGQVRGISVKPIYQTSGFEILWMNKYKNMRLQTDTTKY